jgi:hypothetical protein
VLGNPPWDIAKPNSQEFFSNIDPLYRSYGKQEALRFQTAYFAGESVERAWLDYNAGYRAQSNYVRGAASPFGDPDDKASGGDRFAVSRGRENDAFHGRWREVRTKSRGYADVRHAFRHQGSADLNLYKAFLEQAHALLHLGGRLGFLVPSGLYSDLGSGGLRELLLEHCSWEWLFGFINWEKIFPSIYYRFKFNALVAQKGGTTRAVQTAFVRTRLEDWERAEEVAVTYGRDQIERFSPQSRTILEIQSARDLEILERIYADSVQLGDDGPDGWGATYSREFDMTSDSKLFPPRPVWEAKGYRPDEYSRWLLGDWRPIEELWRELGVDPARVVPAEVELEDWLFDPSAGPERRMAEARFALGHVLRPGDVARSDWQLRCAQPPYDRLPVPRADIPVGIILSREADAWIRAERVEDIALPLYEGRVIGQFDFSQKGWVSGKGRGAVWRDIPWRRKQLEPQFLMAEGDFSGGSLGRVEKVGQMRVASATNARTVIATAVANLPCGDKVATLRTREARQAIGLSMALSSIACDYQARKRVAGLQVDQHILYALAIPSPSLIDQPRLTALARSCMAPSQLLAGAWIDSLAGGKTSSWAWKSLWSLGDADRAASLAEIDACCLAIAGVSVDDGRHMLSAVDHPRGFDGRSMPVTGFWRVDKDKDPELRHTVLTLLAFQDLDERIRACAGDRVAGIDQFLAQNEGDGWILPETVRMADYGLGHDERARQPQPVASRLGPRFYDWQLAQAAEESWRECHLHARNLLGAQGYRELLDEVAGREGGDAGPASGGQAAGRPITPQQSLFE